MHFTSFSLFAALAIVVSASGGRHLSTAITKYGPVFTHNTTSEGTTVYKGIPYAAPPVGNLRWRAPVPPSRWAEPLNATSFRDGCHEFSGRTTTWKQSEDCLYLNVWSPKTTSKKGLPVMVFVHGGGFEFLSAVDPLFDGVGISNQGVVLVTIQYRLGNFGFLARADLDEENQVGNSGNNGIQDIILALKWVKENIQDFGGDPNNVLVFGESAGSHAMGMLMTSPLAQGLFDKVIMQSGSWWDSEHGNMESFQQARAKGEAWGEKIMPNASLADLRQLSAGTVVNSSLWHITLDPCTTAFSPNIDNYVIPKVIPSAFKSGIQSKVPILAGFAKREDLLFQARAIPSANASVFSDRIFDFFNQSGRDEQEIRRGLDTFYPAGDDAETSSISMIGDFVISQQTWEAIHLHSLTTNQPTFLYYFNFTSEYMHIPAHGSDLLYTFGNFVDLAPLTSGAATEADKVLSQNMITYFTNFAKSNDPNLPDTRNNTLTPWPRYLACDSKVRCDTGNAVSTSHRILEFGNTIQAIDFNSSRYEFVASFRDHGVFPASWHDFVLP